MIFRRKRDAETSDPTDSIVVAAGEDLAAADVSDAAADAAAVDAAAGADEPVDRSDGPFDITEVDEPDAMTAERIDFGAIQVPLIDGLEIRVELDQESNEAMAITLVRGEGAVQVRAFAAPRSAGAWATVRADITGQIEGDGGDLAVSVGTFGPEVAAAMSGQDEAGNQVVQPIRFVGVEGPRWLLQGVFFGAGVDPATAADLEAVFRSLVVVRGETAMPVGQMLPLSLPEQVPGEVSDETDDD